MDTVLLYFYMAHQLLPVLPLLYPLIQVFYPLLVNTNPNLLATCLLQLTPHCSIWRINIANATHVITHNIVVQSHYTAVVQVSLKLCHRAISIERVCQRLTARRRGHTR